MKVIRPNTFAPADLVATSATEATAAYNAGTTYALGAQVLYLDNVYESLQPGNVGNTPTTSPTFWIFVRPSNVYAAFDSQISTQTTGATPLTMTIVTGIIDSVYFGNVDAVSIQVVARDGLAGPIVYDETQYLNGETVLDWYQYFFFDPLILRNQALFQGIPPFGDTHLEVTLDNGTADASVGIITYGRMVTLGSTAYGANAGIIDYSTKETDAFGNTTFTVREFSKRLSANVLVENANINRVQRFLYDLRAVPAVWVASDNPLFEEPLLVFGFYRDFTTEIAYPTVSFCSLEIEGLI